MTYTLIQQAFVDMTIVISKIYEPSDGEEVATITIAKLVPLIDRKRKELLKYTSPVIASSYANYEVNSFVTEQLL